VGKSVYGKTCAMCHAAGVAGAPKPGDKADWGPRIAQGKDVLYKHAREGFTGAKGMMPARGGSASLTDDEVKAAVDFMADQSI
jgi:cytochrome c5